jgi:hypothetical protein
MFVWGDFLSLSTTHRIWVNSDETGQLAVEDEEEDLVNQV